ncbi:MAG: hypothetical protein ACR652_19375 [Methylocystis sp.]|uniref:hypothetical protein n=1 Tax=Methylocystis sp. TaxID=1911079 RepID=UPI003DA5DE7D
MSQGLLPPQPAAPAQPFFGVVLKGAKALSWIVAHLAVFSTVAVAAIAAWNIYSAPLRIKDLQILGPLQDSDVINGETLAYNIRDHVFHVFENAKVDQKIMHLEVGDPQPIKVDLPNQKFTVGQVSDFISSLFHIDLPVITGTLALSNIRGAEGGAGQQYRLILRKNGRTSLLFDGVGAIPELIEKASIAIIEEMDPVVAANYVRKLGPSMRLDAIYKAQAAVRATTRKESGFWGEPAGGRQAWLVLGYALGDEGQFEDSDAAFRQAMDHGDEREQARAYDGQAYVRIQAARTSTGAARKQRLFGDAWGFLEQALRAEPGYDSALFHMGEIEAARAMDAVTEAGCDERPFSAASASFAKVTTKKADFAIAYYEEGVLWLNFLNYLQNNHSHANCATGLTAKIDAAISRTDESFRRALRYQIDFAPVWLQWGLLTYQRGQMTSDPHAKGALLDQAIGRFSRSLSLGSSDPFVVRRLSDAIFELESAEEHSGEAGDATYRARGIEIFCKLFPSLAWPNPEERAFLESRRQHWCGERAARSK